MDPDQVRCGAWSQLDLAATPMNQAVAAVVNVCMGRLRELEERPKPFIVAEIETREWSRAYRSRSPAVHVS